MVEGHVQFRPEVGTAAPRTPEVIKAADLKSASPKRSRFAPRWALSTTKPKAIPVILKRTLATLALALAVPGCVTSVSMKKAPDGSVAASYFSTKKQNWSFVFNPETHQFDLQVLADTPTGWSAPEVGGLAKDLGAAIGAAAAKAAKTTAGVP